MGQEHLARKIDTHSTVFQAMPHDTAFEHGTLAVLCLPQLIAASTAQTVLSHITCATIVTARRSQSAPERVRTVHAFILGVAGETGPHYSRFRLQVQTHLPSGSKADIAGGSEGFARLHEAWYNWRHWGSYRDRQRNTKGVIVTGRHWMVAGSLAAPGFLAVVGGGAFVVQRVPRVARLVHGDATRQATVARSSALIGLLSTATLTPEPTANQPEATPSAPQPYRRTVRPDNRRNADRPRSQRSGLNSDRRSANPHGDHRAINPNAAPPTPRPQAQWIVFETKRDGRSDYEIFVMAPDGLRLASLTNSWADDVAPVWSSNGRRIAFVSLRDTLAGKWGLGAGSILIYLMDFDPLSGQSVGEAFPLTVKDTDDGWPAWSPDDQRIAFESDRSGVSDIWVVNVECSGLANLTDHPSDDNYPAWSPDGKRIAFTSQRSGNQDVWVMNADGSNPLNLTNRPDRDRYAMWSPDGKKIAFNTQRDGNQEIYVMNANGSDPKNVSQAPKSTEGLADWSPDGKRLVLYSDRTGNKRSLSSPWPPACGPTSPTIQAATSSAHGHPEAAERRQGHSVGPWA